MPEITPVPAADETAEPRQYVARYDDGSLRVLTAAQLGRDLRYSAHHPDAEPPTLWTFVDGLPVPVGTCSRQTPFDENDYADVRVELVTRNGTVLDVTGYRIDGRA